jgi:hypothetical protein
LRRAFDDRAMPSGIAAGVLLVFAAINCIMAWHHIRRRGFARRACDDRAMASGIATGMLLSSPPSTASWRGACWPVAVAEHFAEQLAAWRACMSWTSANARDQVVLGRGALDLRLDERRRCSTCRS